MSININFYNEYNKEYDLYLEKYLLLANHILDYLQLNEQAYEISLLLVDNDKIKQINNDYRNIDKITDVISFENDNEYQMNEEVIELGDIFISVDKALVQAKEYGNTINREMLFLFCHGFLHCLGYDHQNKEEEKIMFDLQEVILDEFR